MGTQTFNFDGDTPYTLYPGATHYPGFLSFDEQRRLLARCRELEAAPGFYTPELRSGHKMTIGVLCLGLHWDARRYAYDERRTDVDDMPVAPIPDDFITICDRLAARAGELITPDICIVNYYGKGSRLGMHQDKSEREETLRAGIPVISITLGCEADFMMGGTEREDEAKPVRLRSGDGFVFGGPSRMRYHGIKKVYPGTEPAGLDMLGRINVTFRQYWLDAGQRAARAI